eukprot:COSAG02_NODE_180_length_31057_cov_21.869501_3_plen_102_part_00
MKSASCNQDCGLGYIYICAEPNCMHHACRMQYQYVQWRVVRARRCARVFSDASARTAGSVRWIACNGPPKYFTAHASSRILWRLGHGTTPTSRPPYASQDA